MEKEKLGLLLDLVRNPLGKSGKYLLMEENINALEQ